MTAPEHPPERIDLTTFFLSIASAAFLGLDPEKGVNLELAKQNIGLLELMQEKTKGNLSQEETRLLDQLLFELRMHYIEESKPSSKTPA